MKRAPDSAPCAVRHLLADGWERHLDDEILLMDDCYCVEIRVRTRNKIGSIDRRWTCPDCGVEKLVSIYVNLSKCTMGEVRTLVRICLGVEG